LLKKLQPILGRKRRTMHLKVKSKTHRQKIKMTPPQNNPRRIKLKLHLLVEEEDFKRLLEVGQRHLVQVNKISRPPVLLPILQLQETKHQP